MDLIDRQALREAMYHEAFETDSDEQMWDSGCWIRYKMFERILNSMPPAQQTLFGYKIEHLAYIARVMEKEGITAEYAVRTFDDMSRAVRMIIEEAQKKAEEMLNERFNQQAGGD